MSYTLDHLYQLSPDTLDKALSALTGHADHHTEAGRILRAIKARSGCVGRILNKSSVAALQAALPGYVVTYGIQDSLKRRPRCIYVRRLDAQGQPLCGPMNHWSFELATVDEPRLTAERIDERITYHMEQTKRYSVLASDLPAQAAAYNAAAAYLQPIKQSLSTALLYAGL